MNILATNFNSVLSNLFHLQLYHLFLCPRQVQCGTLLNASWVVLFVDPSNVKPIDDLARNLPVALTQKCRKGMESFSG